MKKLTLIISVITLGVMGIGCSKSNSNSANNTTALGYIPPVIIDPLPPGSGGGGGTTPITGGATVDLITTTDKMRAYAAIAGNVYTLNNPTNIKVNINLAQADAGRYGGSVIITYMDNGVQHTGVLKAGMGKNIEMQGGYDNGKLEAEYNYWFTFENRLVFTGFFEDSFGAITLTLTPDVVAGGGNDAEPLNVKYKGEISFRNFKVEKTLFYRACWFNYTGLNGQDCRSNIIQTKCGLAPGVDAGYTVLGTFTNVDIKQAFNIN